MAAMTRNDRFATLTTTLAALFVLSSPATAGPPLICHPFTIGAEPQLPWGGGPDWSSPDRGYDVRKLTADTLELLSPDAPVLARMENLRRATIYATRDMQVATELATAVLARTEATLDGDVPALAWFDAGYLLESFKQYGLVQEWGMLPAESSAPTVVPKDLVVIDGYALVEKAIARAKESRAEMEFAASLMVRDSAISEAHRARAEAGATHGSLLAANLAR
jgi:hypothetical protein